MKETIIQKQLDNLFPDSDLEFQVVYQVPYLKIAINYYSTLSFDHATLRQGIQRALSELNLPEDVEYLALYTRQINETEPDWSTCVRLSATNNSQEVNRDQPSASQNHDTSKQEEEVTAKETESEEPIAREQLQDHHSSETAEQETSPNEQLSDYCFIRNQSLLNQEIVSPPLPVAELVTSFHELSVSEKQQLLPIMSQLLEQETPEGIEEVSAQQWIEQLFALNQEHLRKARIWLSRYCYDPDTTIATIEKVINQPQEPVIQEETEDNSIPTPRITDRAKHDTQKPENLKIHENEERLTIIRTWIDSYTYFFTAFTIIWLFITWQQRPDEWQSDLSVLLSFSIINVCLIYYTLAKWLNKTYIFADRNKLLIDHKPFPWPGKQLRVKKLERLFIERKVNQNNHNDIGYKIYVITYTGAEKKLIEVDNREEAFFITKTLENYFNIGEIGGPEVIIQYYRKGGGSGPSGSAGGGGGDGGC